MDLAEFNKALEHCRTLLDKQMAIATESAPDDLDLSTFQSDGAGLASQSFVTGANTAPATFIAVKDAYDFVVAHDRMLTYLSRDRAHYYEFAKEALTKDKAGLEELSAVIQRFSLYGEQ